MSLIEDRAAGFGLPRPRSATAEGDPHGSAVRPSGSRRGRRLLLWAAGLSVAAAVLVRISLRIGMDADAANKALQGWDLLHGHLLLRGWITGDATFYTLESPLFAVVEAFTGLGSLAAHVVPALVYLLVLAATARLGVGASRGWAARLRAATAVAVLCVPLASPYGVSLLLEQPDHVGTSLFLLACFALIDRAGRGRVRSWAAAIGVLAVCTAGILGDDTVTFVAVPAVVLVCGVRALAARRPFGSDALFAAAALAALPTERLTRHLMRWLGSYWMTRPTTRIAGPRLWPSHLRRTVDALAALFGVLDNVSPGYAALGACALAAAGVGFARVLWLARTLPSADTLELLAAAGIAANLGVYTLSMGSTPVPAHEIAVVLPFGALLAARCVSPVWSWRRSAARRRCALLTAVSLLPLAVSAARPATGPIPTAPPSALATWLLRHGLREGVAGYWDAATLTVDSDGRLAVRSVVPAPIELAMYAWETRRDWYNPALHDATFAIASDRPGGALGAELDGIGTAEFEALLGPPRASYRVYGRTVLVYSGNLYQRIAAQLPSRRKRE
jgi:hypothetical protein